MSDEGGATTEGRDSDPGHPFEVNVVTVGTGVIGGAAIPALQFALWQLVAAGPLTGPGGGELQAEMALFVAVGVAVPAGGVALLYEDDPVSGVLGAATYPLATLALGTAVSVPDWFFQGILWSLVVLAAVAVLEALAGRRDGSGDPAGR